MCEGTVPSQWNSNSLPTDPHHPTKPDEQAVQQALRPLFKLLNEHVNVLFLPIYFIDIQIFR